MAENENGEEKKYPALPGFLRKKRDQGEYPHSREFPKSIVLLLIVIYFMVDYRGIMAKLRALLNIDIFDPMAKFGDNVAMMMTGTFYMTTQILLPIFIIVVIGAILATLVEGGGIVPSFTKITPDFNRLNPSTGFQNLFKINALTEALKGIFKTVTLIIILGLVVKHQLNNMFWAPTCDFECVQGSAMHVFSLCLIIGTVIMLVFGVIDIPVSRVLFNHENMMTFTELKQELKEMFGDPHIRSSRMALAREAAQMERASFDRATLLVLGKDKAVALRFVRGVTPAPLIMAKARDGKVAEMQAEAAKRGMVIARNDDLVEILMKTGLAAQVPAASFDDVARVLIETGLFS